MGPAAVEPGAQSPRLRATCVRDRGLAGERRIDAGLGVPGLELGDLTGCDAGHGVGAAHGGAAAGVLATHPSAGVDAGGVQAVNGLAGGAQHVAALVDAQAADGEAFSEEIGKGNSLLFCLNGGFSISRAGKRIQAVGLQLRPECLRLFACQLGFVHDGLRKSSSRTLKGDIPLHLRILLEQILNCRDDGLLRDVFLAHKKYELLYQQIELLDRENSHKCVSPAECRAAHRAYAILLQDIGKPPSLPELAAAVGVNRTRLTALFRMLFEDTVFGILRRERLECARRLLNEKGKNITEIAYLCGFSSPSHLTKAFSAQFGISPKQYQIARRHGHPAASVSCGEQHT